MEKSYLGDSVYAEMDEFGALILTTENGLPDDPSNTIVLDSEVRRSMADMLARWAAEMEAAGGG